MFDFLTVYGKNRTPLPDHILSQFINCPIKETINSYKEAYYVLSERKDRLALFCGDELKNNIAVSGGAVQFFDGLIAQDKLATDIRSLSPLCSYASSETLGGVFGNYCYGVFSDAGVNHIHGTVLAFYHLYIAFSGGAESGVIAVSNNPYLAAQAVHGAEYKSRKNAPCLMYNAILGVGAGIDLLTAFDNVYYVPQNAGVYIDDNNHVSFFEMVPDFYHAREESEWNAEFEKTHQDLLRWVKHYGANTGNITGGFDSRVTLALAIEAGVQNDITFTIRGYEDHPDVIVAKQICAHYHLKLEMDDIELKDASLVPLSFARSLILHHDSGGLRPFAEVWMNAIGESGVKKIKSAAFPLGGFGCETFRGYLSLHQLLERGISNKLMGEEDREFLFQQQCGVETKNIITKEAYEHIHKNLINYFNTFEDLYSYDLLCNETRLPQFHGWKGYIAPGMHTQLYRLAMALPPELRVAGSVPFKLIEASTPSLLYFPFAEKAWHPWTYIHRKDAAVFKNIKPVFNTNNRPLPSTLNTIEQVKFLFNQNIKLNERLYTVYSEKYINELCTASRAMLDEQRPVDYWMLYKLINIFGFSLFLDNKELQENAGAPASVRFPAQYFIQKDAVYSPSGAEYKEDAMEVVLRGELCFRKHKVFRQCDHNSLTKKERKHLFPKEKLTARRILKAIKRRAGRYIPPECKRWIKQLLRAGV